MKVALLCFHYGQKNRGVETWAMNLQTRLAGRVEIKIISSWRIYHPFSWLGCDVVVATDGRLSVLWCRLLTWLVGKPLVVFGHSGPGADDKWNLLCCPNVFVAFSDWQKSWAQKFKLPPTRLECIPHAVDTQLFVPPQQKVRTKLVLCVAANSPSKRVDLVRRAVARLPGFGFLVVGEGQARRVDYRLMPQVYQKAGVFCFVPQAWEAFGLVLLEAMACNLPVVTISDPVRREIVGPAGVLVDEASDISQLTAAIRLADRKAWANLPRLQAEKFAWDRIALQYDQLFKSLWSR